MKQSFNYWKKRELANQLNQIKDEKETMSQIEKNFVITLADVEHQIKVFYERYSKTEGISIEEAQKRVSEHDVKAFQKKAKEYVKNKDFSPEANEELKLYNATMRINRLELLKAEINLHLTNLTEDNNKEITDHLEKLGKTEYARQAGILDTELRYSKEGIKAIVNSDYKYGNFSKTLWTNQKALMNTIEVMLRRSIIQGGNSTELVGRLRKQFDVGVYEAKRLLVTEAARVQGDVQIDSMEQAGYEEYVYLSEPTACDICKPLDGQHFKIKDREVGVNYYPMHPFCKCSSAAYYDSEKLDKEIAEYRKARGLDKEDVENDVDLMSKSKEFKIKNAINDDIKFSAKKVYGTKYDIWTQDNTKRIRDTLRLVQEELPKFSNVPRVVILKNQKLKGIAGYNRVDDTLYISDRLNSEESIKEILADGYFASKDLKDIITHELAHKMHWDNAKRLYNKKKKLYNSLEEAKKYLDEDLIKYVKMQESTDFFYIENISPNALKAWKINNINEVVAEVAVLNQKLEDKELLNKVKGVLEWK